MYFSNSPKKYTKCNKRADMTYRPRGIIFQVLSLRLLGTRSIMTACLDSRVPGIDVRVVLGCDVVRLTINDEVCDNFGKVCYVEVEIRQLLSIVRSTDNLLLDACQHLRGSNVR